MSVLKAVVLFLRGILSDKAQIAVEIPCAPSTAEYSPTPREAPEAPYTR